MKMLIAQEEEREDLKAELREKKKKEQEGELFLDFEQQMERELLSQDDEISLSSTEVEEQLPEPTNPVEVSLVEPPKCEEETGDDGIPISWTEEPDLYLCDDWILPVAVMRKPVPLRQPQD